MVHVQAKKLAQYVKAELLLQQTAGYPKWIVTRSKT